MKDLNESKPLMGVMVIVACIFIVFCIYSNYRYSKEAEKNSIELCGSVANTISHQEIRDKMPGVSYYAICRVNDKVEIRTK